MKGGGEMDRLVAVSERSPGALDLVAGGRDDPAGEYEKRLAASA